MAILLDALLEGIGDAAEHIRSEVMAEVGRELAPIYRRLDLLEADLRRRRSRPPSRTARRRVVQRLPSSPQPPGG